MVSHERESVFGSGRVARRRMQPCQLQQETHEDEEQKAVQHIATDRHAFSDIVLDTETIGEQKDAVGGQGIYN